MRSRCVLRNAIAGRGRKFSTTMWYRLNSTPITAISFPEIFFDMFPIICSLLLLKTEFI